MIEPAGGPAPGHDPAVGADPEVPGVQDARRLGADCGERPEQLFRFPFVERAWHVGPAGGKKRGDSRPGQRGLAALGVDFHPIAAPYVGPRIHAKIPDPDHFDCSGVADGCRRRDAYAQYSPCYGDLIAGNGFFPGMEQSLVDLVTDDPAGALLADRRFAVQMAAAEKVLDAARGRIDFAWLTEDLGTQDRSMVSVCH